MSFFFFPLVTDILKVFFFFILFFKIYIIVLVLPNIKMNPPQVYMCSPSWKVFLNWSIVVYNILQIQSVSSVVQSCLTVCNPMNHSTPGLPVHHQLLEFTQTHVYRVSDAIQPSHPLSSPSPPAPNPSQNQSLFQWVNSSHEVAKVLEFQLQHQSFQWTPRTDFL